MSETVDLRQQKSEQTRERIVQTFLDMIPQKNWKRLPSGNCVPRRASPAEPSTSISVISMI